ncbi:MAG: cytochrome P450 [Pseudomonadota bacterium]
MSTDLPFLDFERTGFSTRSDEVIAARDQSWIAQTPYGFAVLRHREAGNILRDRRFRQGSYHWPVRMGLKGSFARFWSNSVISQEGAQHKAWRRLLTEALSEDFVLSLVPTFEEIAERLIAPLKKGATCEFMQDFSMPFAGMVNCALLGLPLHQWPDVSRHASNLGLAMGLGCKENETIFNTSCDALMDLSAQLAARARNDASDQSYPARLTRAFDAAGIKEEQVLLDLIVISIFGGVDTTKGQLGFLMTLFGDHPKEWQKLRADPDLADAAINEAIRMRPTTTWATREAVEHVVLQDIPIPQGSTVHVLSHATGTDGPVHDGHFDITAPRRIHFGFGGGAHHCIGHFLARTDMALALKVLAGAIERFEVTQARFHPDSGNTSPIEQRLNIDWVDRC